MAKEDLMPIEEVNSNRSRIKHSEDSRKGGKKSGEARREKKTIQNLLNDLLNKPCKDNPHFEELASKLGLESDKSIKQLFTMVMTMNTLKQGNLDDLKTLIGLIGEKVETEQKTTPAIEELAKSLFGDEQ